MMNAKDRIGAILDNYALSAKAFSERLGMDRPQAVYDILNGKTKSITEKMANKIISVFSDISKSWLMSGVGDMLVSMSNTTAITTNHTFSLKTDRNVPIQKIPLYDFNASAGLVAIFNEVYPEPMDFLQIPNLPVVDGAIFVRGESMSPLLKSGDIVMFKKKELSIESIIWGEIYLLSFVLDGDTYTAVKYIRKSDEDGKVRLVSFNPDFAPKDIPLSSITALALVKASITFHTME